MARKDLKGVLKKKKKWKKSKREKGYSYLQTESGVYGRGARMRDVVSQLQTGKKPNRPPKNPPNYVPRPAVRPDRDDLWNYPDRDNMLSTYPDRESHLDTYPDRETTFALPDRDGLFTQPDRDNLATFPDRDGLFTMPDRDDLATYPDREGHLLTYHDRFEPDEDREDPRDKPFFDLAKHIHRIQNGLRLKRVLICLTMPEEQFVGTRVAYPELYGRLNAKMVQYFTALSDSLNVSLEELLAIQNGLLDDLRGYYSEYMDRANFQMRTQNFLEQLQDSIIRNFRGHDYSELEMDEFVKLGESIEADSDLIVQSAQQLAAEQLTTSPYPEGYEPIPSHLQQYEISDTSSLFNDIDRGPPREDVTFEDPVGDVTGEYMGEMETLGKAPVELPDSSFSLLRPIGEHKASIDLINSTPVKAKQEQLFRGIEKYSDEVLRTPITSSRNKSGLRGLLEMTRLPKSPNLSPIEAIRRPLTNKAEYVTPPSITKPNVSLPQYAGDRPLMTAAKLQADMFKGKGSMTAKKLPKLVDNFNDYLTRMAEHVNTGDRAKFKYEMEKMLDVAANIDADVMKKVTGNSPFKISKNLAEYRQIAEDRFYDPYFRSEQDLSLEAAMERAPPPKFNLDKPEPKPIENSELDPLDDPTPESNIYDEISEAPSEISTMYETDIPKSMSLMETVRSSGFVVWLMSLTVEDIIAAGLALASETAEAYVVGLVMEKIADLIVYLAKSKKLKLVVPQSNTVQGQSNPNDPLVSWKVIYINNPFYEMIQSHMPDQIINPYYIEFAMAPPLWPAVLAKQVLFYELGLQPWAPWQFWVDNPLKDPNYQSKHKDKYQALINDMMNKLISPPDKPTNNAFQQLQVAIHDSKSDRMHIAAIDYDHHNPPTTNELIEHIGRIAPSVRSIPYKLTSAHMSLVNRLSDID